ncbi:YceD family protein [Roseovarius ramblicola]|uniref:DUF177 domain-containing protein n=1 Tax=Roseovarius ramblicola TaxID=2022336 RepID=A0ABV5I1U8_9RHOB
MSTESPETGTTHRIPVPHLARHGGHGFDIVPDAAARKALAAHLDLLDLRKLSLRGEIAPDGPRGWRLDATLGATVVQPCGVTLAPVTTRIDEAVTRRYAPDVPAPGDLPGDEMEMPGDDTLEPLGAVIDLDAVLAEALALALPPWPRAEGAALDTDTATPDGAAPSGDAPRRPFAGLGALRDRLAGEDDDGGSDGGPSG